jgi:hypothetical protein
MGPRRKGGMKYDFVTNKNIEKINSTIDKLAYASLFLDVCIAIITGMSLIGMTHPEAIMVPIHYLLTAVVLMSLMSGGMLMYLRHQERIMSEIIRMRCRIKVPKQTNRQKLTMDWNIRRAKGEARGIFKTMESFVNSIIGVFRAVGVFLTE